jgi:hypothetical protein
VGDNAGAQAFLADGAKTTDLRGRMVIPGIVALRGTFGGRHPRGVHGGARGIRPGQPR